MDTLGGLGHFATYSRVVPGGVGTSRPRRPTEVAAHALAPPENVRPRTAPLWPGQPGRCLYGPGRAAGSSLTAPTASDLWGPGPAFTARGWSDGTGH